MNSREYANRLNVSNVVTIATLFRDRLVVPEKEKYMGNFTSFIPFQSLKDFHCRHKWSLENCPDEPAQAADGCDLLDVRWVPTYTLSNLYDGGKVSKDKLFAYMDYDEKTYETTWFLRLVSIDTTNHRLLIWDNEEKVWAEFGFAEDPVNQPFLDFMRCWINW